MQLAFLLAWTNETGFLRMTTTDLHGFRLSQFASSSLIVASSSKYKHEDCAETCHIPASNVFVCLLLSAVKTYNITTTVPFRLVSASIVMQAVHNFAKMGTNIWENFGNSIFAFYDDCILWTHCGWV